MKFQISPTILICATSLLTGCSWITDFVIKNTSNSQITVEYAYPGECPNKSWPEIPSMQSIDGKDQWIHLPSTSYSCNPTTKLVKVNLPPHRSLRIGEVGNYSGEQKDGSGFEIIRLSLIGKNGTLKYNGDSVEKAFKRVTHVLYVVEY